MLKLLKELKNQTERKFPNGESEEFLQTSCERLLTFSFMPNHASKYFGYLLCK